MDVIISANTGIMSVIKRISLDEDGEVGQKALQELLSAMRKEKKDEQQSL